MQNANKKKTGGSTQETRKTKLSQAGGQRGSFPTEEQLNTGAGWTRKKTAGQREQQGRSGPGERLQPHGARNRSPASNRRWQRSGPPRSDGPF